MIITLTVLVLTLSVRPSRWSVTSDRIPEARSATSRSDTEVRQLCHGRDVRSGQL